MKRLFSLFLFALTFSVLGSSIDSKTFVYDGSVKSIELLLRSEKSHIEYRSEQRESICYRQDIVGFRTVCGGGFGSNYPYSGYGNPYHPIANTGCWSEPNYRIVPYTCMQYASIPYEVKDFDVEAKVNLDVTKFSQEATPGEVFKVVLYGDKLTVDVKGSGKFFIVKNKQELNSTVNGSVIMLDSNLMVELVEAAPVFGSLKMSAISIQNGLLDLDLDIENVDGLQNVGISLKIVKNKNFDSGAVLFDRELLASEIQINSNPQGSKASINLSKLGLKLSSGKFNITAKVSAKFNGDLMNSSQFEELSSSRTLIYKTR